MTDFIAGRDGIRRTVEDLTPHEQAKIAANMFVAMTEDAPKPSKNWLQFRDVWMSTQLVCLAVVAFDIWWRSHAFSLLYHVAILLQAPAIVSLSWLLLSMLMEQ